MKDYLRVALGLALFLGVVQGQAKFQAKIDSSLLSASKSGSGLHTVILSIKDKNHEKTSLKNRILNIDFHEKSSGLSADSSMDEKARSQRVGLVTKTLQEVHTESQADVLSFLQVQKAGKSSAGPQVEVTPLWITNQIILKNVDSELIQQLASHPDVKSVEADKIYAFDDPVEKNAVTVQGNKQARPLEWGVRKVEAPKVWQSGNTGQNVVVGITDTGCTLEHEALTGNWRSENGWLDPTTNTKTPTDVQGHGSHCAGSILGSMESGIGVAPGAQWIACQGCQKNGCSSSALAACGQFMLCPSGNNASCMAPHIVSNSWGSQNFFGSDSSYDKVIDAWRAAGIIPVFAIGNSGQMGCRSTGNPGDSPRVIGIGATAEAGKMATFSSLGPTKQKGQTKPDFAAPGEDIISVKFNTKNEYTKMSGTSMACPHAAGVIALMMSDEISRTGRILTYDQVYGALQKGSVAVVPYAKPYPNYRNCDGKDEKSYPNNHAGYGFMNAPSVISKIPRN